MTATSTTPDEATTRAPDGARATMLAAVRERTLDALASLPERVGRYAVRGELGHGGMGIVYDGHDAVLDRPVAIKVIHHERLRTIANPEALAESFQREMRATSELFHPNLVAILDAGFDDGADGARAFYVMERVRGDSLEQRLQRWGKLPRERALRIGAQIARGLAAVHEHGLVHRDLKPANVLLPEDGEAKVADFGLCCLRSHLGELNGTGAILGSAHFVAPEQVRAEAVDASADLFALGGILLRMLTGRSPFGAPDLPAHLERILCDEPDGLDNLDADARQLVEALLAKEAAQRPSSAAEVAERLETLAARTEPEEAALGDAAPRDDEPGSSRGPSRWRWAIAGTAVLALLVAGIIARNRMIALDMSAEVQWRQVQNELLRQDELLPELVALTERYAEEEREILREVIASRTAYASSGRLRSGREGAALTPELAAGLDATRALSDVLVISERYPELTSGRHYRDLRHEIAGSANRVAVERMRYNEAAGVLNARLRQLPWSLVASDLTARSFFEAPPAVEVRTGGSGARTSGG